MTVAVGYYVAMRVSPLVLIGLGSNLPWHTLQMFIRR